ncbi:unnamed protein product [Peronospora belbahrii]|uniref:cellulose 1,4-beta-cellobiosidase (non-reducing end) n=2 Tax=Peronospora belbahrii TaxID=622444 RepID=A0ABN8DCP6_9STRA|nr:unnamed protein product [Peronospora belbahrii]
MNFPRSIAGFALIVLSQVALGQQIGTEISEVHPSLTMQFCTKITEVLDTVDRENDEEVNRCENEESSIVLDADWRAVNAVGTSDACYTNGKWNPEFCSTPEACAKNCGLEGADYKGTHSITTKGKEIKMKLQTPGGVGTRVYMLDASGKKYKQFNLLNKEFTFDVDVSSLPCGSNAALYFTKMDPDGGTSRFPTNRAGAAYGTGYCNAQCPKDVKFINGEANLKQTYGSCCSTVAVWEANSMATSYSTHACSIKDQHRCLTDGDCGANDESRNVGWCDKPGCGYNQFRMGNTMNYGPGDKFDIDTTKPFTVVTQFLTRDGSDTGELVEIRRIFKQFDKIFDKVPMSVYPKLENSSSITSSFCKASRTLFGESLVNRGGLKKIGKDIAGGMTLAMSISVDYESNMEWLDSYTGDDPTIPGAKRGPCPKPGGEPDCVFAESPNAAVKFFNLRWGAHWTTI